MLLIVWALVLRLVGKLTQKSSPVEDPIFFGGVLAVREVVLVALGGYNARIIIS